MSDSVWRVMINCPSLDCTELQWRWAGGALGVGGDVEDGGRHVTHVSQRASHVCWSTTAPTSSWQIFSWGVIAEEFRRDSRWFYHNTDCPTVNGYKPYLYPYHSITIINPLPISLDYIKRYRGKLIYISYFWKWSFILGVSKFNWINFIWFIFQIGSKSISFREV